MEKFKSVIMVLGSSILFLLFVIILYVLEDGLNFSVEVAIVLLYTFSIIPSCVYWYKEIKSGETNSHFIRNNSDYAVFILAIFLAPYYMCKYYFKLLSGKL